jgi:hypothetical protein
MFRPFRAGPLRGLGCSCSCRRLAAGSDAFTEIRGAIPGRRAPRALDACKQGQEISATPPPPGIRPRGNPRRSAAASKPARIVVAAIPPTHTPSPKSATPDGARQAARRRGRGPFSSRLRPRRNRRARVACEKYRADSLRADLHPIRACAEIGEPRWLRQTSSPDNSRPVFKALSSPPRSATPSCSAKQVSRKFLASFSTQLRSRGNRRGRVAREKFRADGSRPLFAAFGAAGPSGEAPMRCKTGSAEEFLPRSGPITASAPLGEPPRPRKRAWPEFQRRLRLENRPRRFRRGISLHEKFRADDSGPIFSSFGPAGQPRNGFSGGSGRARWCRIANSARGPLSRHRRSSSFRRSSAAATGSSLFFSAEPEPAHATSAFSWKSPPLPLAQRLLWRKQECLHVPTLLHSPKYQIVRVLQARFWRKGRALRLAEEPRWAGFELRLPAFAAARAGLRPGLPAPIAARGGARPGSPAWPSPLAGKEVCTVTQAFPRSRGQLVPLARAPPRAGPEPTPPASSEPRPRPLLRPRDCQASALGME